MRTRIGYRVTADDSVRALPFSEEFYSRKPDVMASGRLVAMCEWPCMDLLRTRITPLECSLGVWQRMEHLAPIVIGAELVIEATCTLLRRRYSEWDVTVHDEAERVGAAQLGFVTVDQGEFESTRLRRKPSPAAVVLAEPATITR
ncbi:thioesterase family protein [Amycolatopsis sp. WQ 127309]|uniref:thioesterase family protein n=1 Tax=Amycolatopsis sp. WQ 127309 TaxID=2932773 RepID=UPI001FF5E0DE|nr:hotdog domain-containing protein [Amycolatopsis sp. WQ 127309]UOZ06992.1 hypothetical protein MUY22_01470 [Amycolatopsis sp. WQ 127309]